MKCAYVLTIALIAVLFFQCKKADKENSDKSGLINHSYGSKLKGEFTIFALTRGQNMSLAVNQLNTTRLNVVNYFINGIDYEYSSDGTVSLNSESTLAGDSYRLLETKREVVKFDGIELLFESGMIDYKSNFSGEGLKVESTLEVEAIGKNFHLLFNRLVIKAVKSQVQKESRGTIYPLGELTVKIEGSKTVLTAGFLLFEE